MGRTKAKEKLLQEAQAAGWTIETIYIGWVDIKKYTRHIETKRRYPKDWWRLYDNGSMINMKIPIDVAKSIRSHKEMRFVLGITSE